MVLLTKIGNTRRKIGMGEIVDMLLLLFPSYLGEVSRGQLAVCAETEEQVLDLILGSGVVRI